MRKVFFEQKQPMGDWFSINNASNPSDQEISFQLKQMKKYFNGPVRAVDESGRLIDILQ